MPVRFAISIEVGFAYSVVHSTIVHPFPLSDTKAKNDSTIETCCTVPMVH